MFFNRDPYSLMTYAKVSRLTPREVIPANASRFGDGTAV
jgi:hypothetical protein